MNNHLPIASWPKPFRKLIFVFTLVALTGFLIGAVFIEATTHLTTEGVVQQYKGMDRQQLQMADKEMKFPKPVKDMLTTTHNHIMGLSVLFLVIGLLYLHTDVTTSKIKMAIAVEPLLALIVTFGGLWIVRFVWEPFVYIVMLSGMLMVGSYIWMSMVILYHILSANHK